MPIVERCRRSAAPPANTAVDITDRGFPTVNRVCGRDDAQGAAGAAYAINTLKVKSVYIINDKTVYGAGVAKALTKDMLAARPQTMWRYRELMYFLAWRDLAVRYKQTAIGVAWARGSTKARGRA